MSDRIVVVFDFDLTLTRWETASRFFKGLLRRQPWRLAVVVLALPVLVLLWVVPQTQRWPVRFAVWMATFGRSRQALAALAVAHADAVFAGPAPVFLAQGVERLRQHLEQGDEVVIATGCWEPLARALLEREGLQHVPLVASTLRPFVGGWISERHCLGENKIPMLTERGYPPPWRIAYTDHRADLPLLRNSEQWYLVSPGEKCLRLIEQTMMTKARIVPWRNA
ncbi:HAD family hydrolase [Stenotrophomonas sp.]|uniref:HAD family hydrolase n=1 Tax=Stenotrophomonas sp. TaxID=69392 RepID=UPI0029A3D448|nr:HAD family hydrolase [Stenotrophomonas sp.]MDX3934317.1 HAD family hydrolase [Stenotrophomonas sp.]